MHAPIVTVTFDGKEIGKFEGDPGFGDPPVSVQIANLDPGNPHPEVIVSFYTEARIAARIRRSSPAARMAPAGRRSISDSSTAAR